LNKNSTGARRGILDPNSLSARQTLPLGRQELHLQSVSLSRFQFALTHILFWPQICFTESPMDEARLKAFHKVKSLVVRPIPNLKEGYSMLQTRDAKGLWMQSVLAADTLTGDKVVNRQKEDLGTIEHLMIDVEKGRVAYEIGRAHV
jgi:hypothetical protein